MADELFNFPGTNYTKDAFTSALRFAFGNMPNFPDYKYTTDEATNKIQIYKEFPRRIFRPPTIVVKAGPTTADLSSLGDKEYLSLGDETNLTTQYNGKLLIPINISINALTTTDREKITDLTTFFIRHLFREKFAELGITYTKISQAGESQFEWDNQIVYTNGLTIDTYQEYTASMPNSLTDLINSFKIEIVIDDLVIDTVTVKQAPVTGIDP